MAAKLDMNRNSFVMELPLVHAENKVWKDTTEWISYLPTTS